MSLTKRDLSDISKVVNKRINPIGKRLGTIDKKLDKVVGRLDKVDKNIKTVKDDINMVIGFFDREYLNLKGRIERIEDFLKIPPLTS